MKLQSLRFKEYEQKIYSAGDMAESGIDLGFDLEFDLNLHLFNENDSNMEFMPNVTVAGNTENVEFYELKSTRSLRTDEM